MNKKILSLILISMFILAGFSAISAKENESYTNGLINSNKTNNDQATIRTIVLGDIYAKCENGYYQWVKCYRTDKDIIYVPESGETINFQVNVSLTLTGLFDWADAHATVNGVEKDYNGGDDYHEIWIWTINCQPGNYINYHLHVRLTDIGGYDESDDCGYEVPIIYIPPKPDLDTDGSISELVDYRQTPHTFHDSFTVTNVGEPGSELNWKISSYPDWGSFSFNPSHGSNVGKGDDVTVGVTFSIGQYTTPYHTLSGDIKVVNSDDSNNFKLVSVTVDVPRCKILNSNFLILLKDHTNLFPILQKLINKLGQ